VPRTTDTAGPDRSGWPRDERHDSRHRPRSLPACGTRDASFDGDGILTADFHGRGEFGQDPAFDPAGRIVAAGYTANGGDTQFALMRANP
jgi:hypothetical protein